MASDKDFVDFVMDQFGNETEVSFKRMFGEYGLYYQDKIFALICDNKLFIKPTDSGRVFLKENSEEAPPYPQAKPYFLIEDQLDDREWLQEMMKITSKELPEPKKKKKKKR